jgi:hypothetical protein
MPDVFPELPKVSFKFSLDVATVYAIEMALHAHEIEMRQENSSLAKNFLRNGGKHYLYRIYFGT